VAVIRTLYDLITVAVPVMVQVICPLLVIEAHEPRVRPVGSPVAVRDKTSVMFASVASMVAEYGFPAKAMGKDVVVI